MIDWAKADRRHQKGSLEQRLFDGISRMIAVRKNTAAFADFNNRELIATGNPHLFVFLRNNPFELQDQVLVVGNFDDSPQSLDLGDLGNRGDFSYGRLRDLYSGETPKMTADELLLPPYRFYWLSSR